VGVSKQCIWGSIKLGDIFIHVIEAGAIQMALMACFQR
jgi:hypothetical protein